MARVDVVWIPLGAGATGAVHWSGLVYERWHAGRQHEEPRRLFHAALLVTEDTEPDAIEMGPQWYRRAPGAEVALVGPVGGRRLGRFRWFRYEVRRSPHGWLPDARFATAVVTASQSPAVARAVLDLLPAVPPLTWGRDECGTGEMWNSNSVVAWLLTGAGVVDAIGPPAGGRAPGWSAGVAVAREGACRPVSLR